MWSPQCGQRPVVRNSTTWRHSGSRRNGGRQVPVFGRDARARRQISWVFIWPLGAARTWRNACRWFADSPLMSRSISKIASIRRTASTASGALATSACTNSLRHAPRLLFHALRARNLGQSRPTPGLKDRAGFACGVIELVEPGIDIGLQNARVAHEMAARMFAGAVARVVEDRRRRRRTAERLVVAYPSGEDRGGLCRADSAQFPR